MNILSETGGQTCNQFWQYLYYLKEAIINKNILYVQLPDKTIEDYPNLLNNKYIKFPFYSPYLTKRIGFSKSLEFSRKFTVLFLNNYVRFVLHTCSFGKLNFYSGKPTWGLESVEYKSILPILQELFDLKSSLKAPVDDLFKDLDKDDTLYCGVHMRGGDYRKWKNGIYFFEQSKYRKFIDRFIELNKAKNKNIRFYIASNEPIDKDVFDGIDWFYLENATATQDLYALSKCNYLIGTLSSYNSWVSLVWQRPLLTILSMDQLDNLSLDDFSIVINYTKKNNGWRFPRADEFFKGVNHPWLYRHSNNEHSILKNLT